MSARRSVWPDPQVRSLAARFVPAADEVARLQRTDTFEGVLFRKVAEQGHYAGRKLPTSTRQGIYAFAPDGTLLASVNSTEPRNVARMLRRGLAAWEKRPRTAVRPDGAERRPERDEDRYPEDGLVLAVTSRDLPRGKGPPDPAWNRDFAWFSKAEARSILPETLSVGESHEVPVKLVRRLARFHLVDNVRGQTLPYRREHVRFAVLRTRVARVTGDSVLLLLRGETRTREEGRWRVDGFRDSPSPRVRGFAASLLGLAIYDRRAARFRAFELVALGMRTGGTRYNDRGDDPGPAPMGILFRLAADRPENRVAPAFLWAYGW